MYSFSPLLQQSGNFTPLVPGNTNCSIGIAWIWNILGTCVFDVRGYFSVIFGCIAIVVWVSYAIPQIYENYKRGIPDEAISPFLLLFWTIGDCCNFTGAILAKQLILQIFVAGFSILIDVILSVQFFYCLYKHKQILRAKEAAANNIETFQEQGPIEVEPLAEDGYPPPRAPVTLGMFGIGIFLLNGIAIGNTEGSDDLNKLFPESAAYYGYALGWVSSAMYLSSRFPQLYRNWSRKTTDGLSIGLFILAVTGNTSYGLQIFLTSTDWMYLLRSLPWLMGSMGVLGLDMIMLAQFYWYRGPPTVYQVLENEDGHAQAEPLFGAQTGQEARIAPTV